MEEVKVNGHCPCELCDNSVGGIDCKLNCDSECKAGGGFEMWEPQSAQREYIAQLEEEKEHLQCVINALREELERLKEKPNRILEGATVGAVCAMYMLILYRLCLLLLGR